MYFGIRIRENIIKFLILEIKIMVKEVKVISLRLYNY